MRLARLIATACLWTSLQGQAVVAVFNDWPTVKGMTIGPSHVYIWSGLPAPWPLIVGYYDADGSGTVQGVVLTGTRKMEGQFNTADGAFTWTLQNDPTGGVDFGLAATPAGGVSLEQKGTF